MSTSALYYKQQIVVLDTAESVNLSTGSLFLKGGAGIEKNVNIGGSVTSGSVFVSGASLTIPVGNNDSRVNIQGNIRYSTQLSSFEGFDGTNWGSLGGVIDIDQDTYIKAPGTDDDYLTFVTNGVERMRINSAGSIILNSTASLIVSSGSSFYGPANFYSTASFVAITTGELKVTGSSVLVGAVSTGALAATTSGGAITFNGVNVTPNQGDIWAQQYFTYTGAPVNVVITDLKFDNAKVSSFNAMVQVETDGGEHAAYEVKGLQKGTSGEWVINSSFIGDNIGIVFDITNQGQLRFTCSKEVTYKMRFRSMTTDLRAE